MSRCLACNKALNDYESTRKYKGTTTYIDLCSSCFSMSDMVSLPVDDVPDFDNVTNNGEDYVE